MITNLIYAFHNSSMYNKSMDESPETTTGQPQELTSDERQKIFRVVNEIVGNQNDPDTVKIQKTGWMDSADAKDLIENAPTLDLGDAKPGDVIWYRTKNSTNYFLLTNRTLERDILEGSFQSVRNDGKEGRSYERVYLNGAGAGGTSIAKNSIKKGFPVELALPRDPQATDPRAKIIESTPVQEMGIIRDQEIVSFETNTL